MPDLTNQFQSIVSQLVEKNATYSSSDTDQIIASLATKKRSDILKPIARRSLPKDAFLAEANTIALKILSMKSFILSCRPLYLNLRLGNIDSLPGINTILPELSISPRDISLMDESQKDVLDKQLSTILKNYFKLIKVLSSKCRENLPIYVENTRRGKWNILSRRGSVSSAEKVFLEHRESVIAILEQQLMNVSEVLSGMQEKRLEKNMEMKSSFLRTKVTTPKSVESSPKANSNLLNGLLSSPKTTSDGSGWFGGDDIDMQVDRNETDPELTEHQRAILEQENARLLEQLDGTLDSVRNAMQALTEISELQNTMAQHLSAQNEQINTIYQDADDSDLNVTKGNENLVSAKRYFGGPRYWVGWFFIIASFVLLFLDYYWP